MIQDLKTEASIPQVCDVFDCPRRTDYYQSVRRDESQVVAAIEQVLMRRPWFGYRRLVAQLQRDGLNVGETGVRRLLKELAHSRSVGQVRVQTTHSNHPYTRYTHLIRGLKVKAPNQVWVADITYIGGGTKFSYLAVILDAFSRAVRGWALSRSLSQQLTVDALKMALTKGKPLIFILTKLANTPPAYTPTCAMKRTFIAACLTKVSLRKMAALNALGVPLRKNTLIMPMMLISPIPSGKSRTA